MKILFLYPNAGPDIGDKYHYVNGIGYISSVIKEGGHESCLEIIYETVDSAYIKKLIDRHNPDIIGISSTTPMWQFARQYAEWIKEYSQIPVMIGGIHPTSAPEEVISHKAVDIICIGEGEYATLELLNKLEAGENYRNIENLWFKDSDGSIIKNPLRPLISNLDELPFPDRDIFDMDFLIEKNIWLATLVTSGRGCPYNCTFCCHSLLKKKYNDLEQKYVRQRSVEDVIRELTYLKTNYAPSYFLIYDDTFTWNREWVMKFCESYAENELNIPFAVNVRVETVDSDLLTTMKDAGLDMIIAGIETGNERLREKVLNKRIDNERIKKVFRIADEMNIKTYTTNMVGIPGETAQTIVEGIKLNWELEPDKIQISIFTPFPGTELYQLCKEKGYLGNLEKKWFYGYFSQLKLPTVGTIELALWTFIYRLIARFIQLKKAIKRYLGMI